MSYDLYFWRQEKDLTMAPSKILAGIHGGDVPVGVERIPSADVIARLRKEFPEIWENHTSNPKHPLQLFWDAPSGRETFQLSWSDFHIGIEGHGLSSEVCNRLIAVLAEFGCALYDPQTGVRYHDTN